MNKTAQKETQEIITPELVEASAPIRRQEGSVVTPPQMMQLAIERGADIDQLERLMDLQQRWEEKEAKKSFSRALAAFKANPPKIVKDAQVDFTSKNTGERTSYDHATLGNVCNAIGGALSDHGLSYRWETIQEDGDITVTCILSHEDGHSESTPLTAAPDNSGKKNSIQAIGSTVTYLQRYTLLSATGMAVMGMDDDGRGGSEPIEKIEQWQVDNIKQLVIDAGVDSGVFDNWMKTVLKVECIEDLTADLFDRAVNKLEATLGANK